MSIQAMHWVFQHSPYPGTSRLIHLVIADVVNDSYDNRFWMGEKQLACKALCSVRTVERAVARMIEDGYLEIINDRHAPGRPNEYRFLMPITPDKMSGVEKVTPDKMSGEHPTSTTEHPTSTTSLYIVNSKELNRTQEHSSNALQSKAENQPPLGLANTNQLQLNEDHSKANSKTATTKGKATKPRERDPLFDAMAEACGHNLSQLTPMGGKSIGIAVSQIRSQNPTPEIIWEKAELYKELHPTWELTPTALVKYWSVLQPGTERRTTQDMKLEELEQNVKEAVEQARAKFSNAASDSPASQSTGTHEAPEAPRTVAVPQNDGLPQKVTNPASDRNSGVDTPKTKGPNIARGLASAEVSHKGLNKPAAVGTLVSEGNLPSASNLALELTTAPLTEPLHVPTTNNGSQDSLSEDFPSDEALRQWLDAQWWEDNVMVGDDDGDDDAF